MSMPVEALSKQPDNGRQPARIDFYIIGIRGAVVTVFPHRDEMVPPSDEQVFLSRLDFTSLRVDAFEKE